MLVYGCAISLAWFQVKDVVWVQCENRKCLKWRRLRRDQAAYLDHDAPWYCFMNPDSTHSSCGDPEEDYRHYESLVRKSKLYYVTSMLPCGSLVWGKLPGYCRSVFSIYYVCDTLPYNLYFNAEEIA